MAGTVTARVTVTKDAYVNVSATEVNCAISLLTGQQVRVIIGPVTPAPFPNAPNYITLRGPGTSSPHGGIFAVEGLAAIDDIWVRAEETDVTIGVIRGVATLHIADSASG